MTYCRSDGRCEICDPPTRQDPNQIEDDEMTPEPSPTRCDCRHHDDGTTTVCGVHQPPQLMYYTDAD